MTTAPAVLTHRQAHAAECTAQRRAQTADSQACLIVSPCLTAPDLLPSALRIPSPRSTARSPLPFISPSPSPLLGRFPPQQPSPPPASSRHFTGLHTTTTSAHKPGLQVQERKHRGAAQQRHPLPPIPECLLAACAHLRSSNQNKQPSLDRAGRCQSVSQIQSSVATLLHIILSIER